MDSTIPVIANAITGAVKDLYTFKYAVLGAIAVPIILLLVRKWYESAHKIRERRRKLYAEAYTVCMEYKEFPFIIYRRNHLEPEAERARISAALVDVQKRMAYYHAWLGTESPRVAKAYDKLVNKLHELPGKEMKKAWKTPAVTTDAEMIITNPIDWSGLKVYERGYIKAVEYELKPWLFKDVRFKR